MFYDVKHVTRFAYSRPVFCEPLWVRLRPRVDAAQAVHRYRLEIRPEPVGLSEFIDLDGNLVALAWFEGLTCSLSVTSTWLVETLRSNPFDFLLPPGALSLPLKFASDEDELARHYATPGEVGPKVIDLAGTLRNDSGGETLEFLTRLVREIDTRCEKIVREEGTPWSPERTLAEGQGSCRDLALLFIETCRWVGIPARFVSGYHEGDPEGGERALHAWAEVYLPGVGWRGFDPTLGLAVADRHVAVAAGRSPRSAAPTEGSFRGSDVRAQLTTQLILNALGPRLPDPQQGAPAAQGATADLSGSVV